MDGDQYNSFYIIGSQSPGWNLFPSREASISLDHIPSNLLSSLWPQVFSSLAFPMTSLIGVLERRLDPIAGAVVSAIYWEVREMQVQPPCVWKGARSFVSSFLDKSLNQLATRAKSYHLIFQITLLSCKASVVFPHPIFVIIYSLTPLSFAHSVHSNVMTPHTSPTKNSCFYFCCLISLESNPLLPSQQPSQIRSP